MAIWSQGNVPRSTCQSSDRHRGDEGHRQQPQSGMNACRAALVRAAGALCRLSPSAAGACDCCDPDERVSAQLCFRRGRAAAGLADTQKATGEAAARVQCTACHTLPPADLRPRSRWRDEIARMFLIRSNQPEPSGPPGTAARMVRLPADWQAILEYYEAHAPRAASLPGRLAWPRSHRALRAAGDCGARRRPVRRSQTFGWSMPMGTGGSRLS